MSQLNTSNVPSRDSSNDRGDHAPATSPAAAAPLTTWAPDIAMEIGGLLSQGFRAALVSALRGALLAAYEVMHAISPSDAHDRIGIWSSRSEDLTQYDARQRGLAAVSLIDAADMAAADAKGATAFAWFLNGNFIRRIANDAWHDYPKQLNEQGKVDPNGSVHLTGFSLDLIEPDTIKTRVDGYDDRAWPDALFDVTLTDVLSVFSRQLTVRETLALHTNPALYWLLSAIAFPLFVPLAVFFQIEAMEVASANQVQTTGFGLQLLRMIPTGIPIPQGEVLLGFGRVSVSSSAVSTVGFFELVVIPASVKIVGFSKLYSNPENGLAAGLYRIRCQGLWPPYTVQWQSTGTISQATNDTTPVSFDVSGEAEGSVVHQNVTVSVTDRFSSAASATLDIAVHVTPARAHPRSSLLRPWLLRATIEILQPSDGDSVAT